jgi:adenylate kinase family enzyme
VRIAVLGTSGSGKTTLAARLARALDIPHVELDAINWQAGWRDLNTHDPEEFRRRVGEAVSADAWITDSGYSRVRDLVLARATHLVWLDYPRHVVMRQVIWRSFTRAATKAELWPGTGNREKFSRWLSREHPIRWAWDTWRDRRERYGKMFDDSALAGLERRRLAHPRETDALIEHLRRDVGDATAR